MIWRIAWRNLWRHRTRTIIMTSAVAFIYGMMLLSMGMNDDGHERMLQEAARAAGGDIVIHAEGYWDTRSSDFVIRDAAAILDQVSGTEGVTAAIPRVLVSGLVSTSAGAKPVMLQGIVPALEGLQNDYADDLVAGTFLESDRADPIVLGVRLVEELEIELGDRVVLTAADPEGEISRALFHLVGVISTGTREVDELFGFTTLAAAQSAVGMDGMLTQIGVITSDGHENDVEVAANIRASLEGANQGIEVLPWREAVPEMVGFVQIDETFGYIYLVVILSVVLFSITNTFLMAVMERVRELGLLSALGLRGEKIGQLLLAETVLMTTLAMSIGFVLGYGGHLAVDHWGVSLSGWGIEELEVAGVDFADMVMHSTIIVSKWIVGSLLVAGATIASAVYPAWKSSRLAPAEAMRFFE